MPTLIWDCHRNDRVQFEHRELDERSLFFVGMVEDKALLQEPWRHASDGAFIPSHYHLAKVVGEPIEGLLPAGTVLEIVQSRTVQEVRDAGGTGTIAAFQEEA